MHIKQITISGFKSYRDATIAGPFSPGHNVVVGRNGSGKSNFFDAVRFVLSDTFSALRAEERVALLHEGASASVLSAYVEMLFDNSDGRLPSDRDEVTLRRMVGLKKDEYLLDRKNVTRTEVFNLLESAGFSRSNPYYIVQQGKVAALCAMTDKQRLDLLKEVAGTRVYDERREESLKIMEETDAKREKISEVVNYIESRLAELESEKEELKAFQRLDKERKALQYTIYVRELEEAKAALDSLDGDNEEQRSRGEELSARLIEVRASIAASERESKSIAPEVKRAQDERNARNSRRKEIIDRIAKLQVDVADAEQAAVQAQETVATTKAELREVNRLIREKNDALKPLEAEYKNMKDQENTLISQRKEIDRELLNLRVKADRSNQFSSVQERDNHIRRNVRDARKRRSQFESQIIAGKKDIERLERAVERNQEKLQTRRSETEQIRADVSSALAELSDFRKERDQIHGKRQEIWGRENELNEQIRELKNGMKKLEATKRSVLGSGAYNAIQAVMKFAAEDPRYLGPNRVYGALVDLINVDSKFSTAADVTAGSALTHVLVDTDATAARLVRIMQSKRAGRVTFIPLNRLEEDPRPPPSASSDAIPLVSKISTDPRFMGAVRQVFGRTLVTRTVNIATELSRQYGVDCVTLEGDQVNKRGAMTGGFVDISRSRIDAARFLREARVELAEVEPKLHQLRREVDNIDAPLSRVLGEVQHREAVERSSNAKISRLRDEIRALENYISSDKENLPRANERIKEAEESIDETDKNIEDLEKELATPLSSGLSATEDRRMNELKSDLEQLQSSIGSLTPRRASIEKQVETLRTELKNNLERRKADLQRTISSVTTDGADGDDVERRANETLKNLRESLATAEAELDSIKDELTGKDTQLVEKKKKFNRLNAQIEQGREEEAKINKTLEDDRQLVEKRYSQKSIETEKKSEAEKKIRELGSLPADFDKYRGQAMSALMKRLKRVNQSLQKYSHVNKKALDQFINFTEQRDTLSRNREDLDSGAAAIRQLIESLDQRKDEDILRTYKGVSKFFSEVFAELVPGGKSSLVMLKSNSSGRNNRDGQSGSRIQYSGVAMKVSFTSTGEAYLLRQLSGGQKSIVALALIFAIQRLDPAPFYLFDEIDANLDATHRQAVANLIRKQANSSTQFITTTFRPEFVNAGDMWYGVTHKKKVSSVQEVDRDVALTFITDEPSRR